MFTISVNSNSDSRLEGSRKPVVPLYVIICALDTLLHSDTRPAAGYHALYLHPLLARVRPQTFPGFIPEWVAEFGGISILLVILRAEVGEVALEDGMNLVATAGIVQVRRRRRDRDCRTHVDTYWRIEPLPSRRRPFSKSPSKTGCGGNHTQPSSLSHLIRVDFTHARNPVARVLLCRHLGIPDRWVHFTLPVPESLSKITGVHICFIGRTSSRQGSTT